MPWVNPFPRNPPDPTATRDWVTCQPVARGSTSGFRKVSKRFCWYGARCRQNGRATTPIATLRSITVNPSHTYGRHHNSNPNSNTIHAPHTIVENDSTNPMTGEASNTNSDGLVPAQYSMLNRIAISTRALPRSGSATISTNGTPAMRQGGTSSRSVAGAARRSASQRASINTTASFTSSDGCPSRCPAMVIQALLLAAVPPPVPVPKTSVSSSSTTDPRYTYGVAHSSSRGETRNTRITATSATPSQISCFSQIVVTKVGTSVCPAE